MTKNKHMTLEDRIKIYEGLSSGLSFKAIAREIGKDCTTVSKEIRINSRKSDYVSQGRIFNNCIHRYTCSFYDVCPECSLKRPKICRSCGRCRKYCPQFEEEICEKLSKPPYVCNGCSELRKCSLSKVIYNASEADRMYRERLSDSREGISISESDIERLNSLLVPLVKNQGQSIHHVYINHSDEIMMAEKTLYKVIDAGLLQVRNIDMPRKVRMRPRKSRSTGFKVDRSCQEGRKYEDFRAFMEEHPDMAVVEMDSVEGVKGESCLLTLHFTQSNFMVAFKRDYNDSRSVTETFNRIYKLMGAEKFRELFPVILTDNGSEFSNPKAIELDENGERRTYVFYCDPSAPHEKSECEVNHEFIRRVVPKGRSWNRYTQDSINLMMSHINSYGRKKLNNRSPYLLFSTLYGEETASRFSIKKIEPDDINLTPNLLNDIKG